MIKSLNLPLVFVYIGISSLGLLNLFVLNPNLFLYQFIFFLVSFVVFLVVSFTPLRVYELLSYPLYILNILLLLLVFVFGEITRGSTRWIAIGGINIQPSEIAKLTLVLALSLLLSKKKFSNLTLKEILFTALVFFPSFILVFLQPDLGTSIIFLVIFIVLLVVAGVNKNLIFIGVTVAGILSAPIWSVLQNYQKSRVVSFLNPSADPLGTGYNVLQSKIAIGSGGFWGKGLGAGTQSHLSFLPENTTDFVFAAFSEEWGFIGSILIVVFYFLLLFIILSLVRKKISSFSRLVLYGILVIFFMHILVNIGMNIGVMPVTGIPLPFFSYGGSSFLSLSIMLGVVNSVANNS